MSQVTLTKRQRAKDIRAVSGALLRTTNFESPLTTEGLYRNNSQSVFFDDLRQERRVYLLVQYPISLLNSLSVGFQDSQYQKDCRPYQQDSCQRQDRVWQVRRHSDPGTKSISNMPSGNIVILNKYFPTAIERTLRH